MTNEIGKDCPNDGNVSICDGDLIGARVKLEGREKKKPWVEGQRMKMGEINKVQDRVIGSTLKEKMHSKSMNHSA